MKPKFQKLYMDWALRVAELSYAKRRQVGAVIVKDDTVISYGYNGMPAGWDNNCENRIYPDKLLGDYEQHYDEFDAQFPLKDEEGNPYHLKTKPEVLHAESNAISKLAKSHNSGLGAELFVTTAPCIHCAKLIFQSGITRVYFGENYRDDHGIRFLKQSGVEVTQLSKE